MLKFIFEAIWFCSFLRDLFTDSISLRVNGRFKFAISSWFNLVSCMFFKNFSISLRWSYLLTHCCSSFKVFDYWLNSLCIGQILYGLFILFLPSSVLTGFMILGNYPFLPCYLLFFFFLLWWHISFHSSPIGFIDVLSLSLSLFWSSFCYFILQSLLFPSFS